MNARSEVQHKTPSSAVLVRRQKTRRPLLAPGAGAARNPYDRGVRMIRMRRAAKAGKGSCQEEKHDNLRLPIRWAVIFLAAGAAAAIAYRASGAVPALMAGAAIITVLHQILD